MAYCESTVVILRLKNSKKTCLNSSGWKRCQLTEERMKKPFIKFSVASPGSKSVTEGRTIMQIASFCHWMIMYPTCVLFQLLSQILYSQKGQLSSDESRKWLLKVRSYLCLCCIKPCLFSFHAGELKRVLSDCHVPEISSMLVYYICTANCQGLIFFLYLFILFCNVTAVDARPAYVSAGFQFHLLLRFSSRFIFWSNNLSRFKYV